MWRSFLGEPPNVSFGLNFDVYDNTRPNIEFGLHLLQVITMMRLTIEFININK
jgi:hypothetical protein